MKRTRPSLKVLIIIGCIVLGLFLLAAGIFITYRMLNQPLSQADYSRALTQAKRVVATTQAVATNFNSLSEATTANEFDNYVAIAQSNLSLLRSETEQLGAYRALQTDEGQQLYQTLQVRVDAFIIHTSNSLTSAQQSRSAFDTCATVTTNSSPTALTTCANALSKVGSVPDADMQQLITVLAKDYKSLAVATSAQKPALSDDVSKALNTYAASVEANQKAVNPAAAMNSVTDYLQQKARTHA